MQIKSTEHYFTKAVAIKQISKKHQFCRDHFSLIMDNLMTAMDSGQSTSLAEKIEFPRTHFHAT